MIRVNTSYRTLASLITLLALSAALSTPSWALNSDRNQTINIQADKAISNEKTGVTTYEGTVQIDQGSLRILADRVTIERQDNKVKLIVAKGKPARFQQRPAADKNMVVAEGFTINYLVAKDRITLKRHALLEQEGTTMTGESIDYDIAQSVVKAGDGNTGAQGRVQIVIPAQNDTSAETASPVVDASSETAIPADRSSNPAASKNTDADTATLIDIGADTASAIDKSEDSSVNKPLEPSKKS